MTRTSADFRTYWPGEVVTFRKTNEDFGGLSNMAPGFPLALNGTNIRTSEALYQACRYPHMPDVQHMIIAESSPMTAKMKSKPYRDRSRADWDDVRIPIMRWCLRIKLAQNWDRFSRLLLATGSRPIVEDSRKDDYWGAMRSPDGHLEGRNVLGRMLMELREQLRQDPDQLKDVYPLSLENFTLFQIPLPVVRVTLVPSSEKRVVGKRTKPTVEPPPLLARM